jgi:hypothetical protein
VVYVLTQVFKLTGTTMKQLTEDRREQLQQLLNDHVGDWDDLTVSAGQKSSMNIQFSTTCDPKPLLGHMKEIGNQLSNAWDANLTIKPGRAIRQKTQSAPAPNVMCLTCQTAKCKCASVTNLQKIMESKQISSQNITSGMGQSHQHMSNRINGKLKTTESNTKFDEHVDKWLASVTCNSTDRVEIDEYLTGQLCSQTSYAGSFALQDQTTLDLKTPSKCIGAYQASTDGPTDHDGMFLKNMGSVPHVVQRGVGDAGGLRQCVTGVRSTECCAAGSIVDVHHHGRCTGCTALRKDNLKKMARTGRSIEEQLEWTVKELKNTRKRELTAKKQCAKLKKRWEESEKRIADKATDIATPVRRMDIVVVESKILTERLVKELHDLLKLNDSETGQPALPADSFRYEFIAAQIRACAAQARGKHTGIRWSKTMIEFITSIRHYGGQAVLDILRGEGMKQGAHANLFFPSESTIQAYLPKMTFNDGVHLHMVETAAHAALAKGQSKVALCMDACDIVPSVQYRQVGGEGMMVGLAGGPLTVSQFDELREQHGGTVPPSLFATKMNMIMMMTFDYDVVSVIGSWGVHSETGENLTRQFKEAEAALLAKDVTVVALVTDAADTNKSLIKNYGKHYFCILDPPHVLKTTRNPMLSGGTGAYKTARLQLRIKLRI